MKKLSLCLLAAILASVGPLGAQEKEPPPVPKDTVPRKDAAGRTTAQILRPRAGSLLRISKPTGETVVGELTLVTADSLVLRRPDSTAVYLPMTEAAMVELRERISRTEGAREWGLKGFLIGGTIGALLPLSDCGACGGGDPTFGDMAISGLTVGGASGLMGAIAGALDPGERWTKLEKPKGKEK